MLRDVYVPACPRRIASSNWPGVANYGDARILRRNAWSGRNTDQQYKTSVSYAMGHRIHALQQGWTCAQRSSHAFRIVFSSSDTTINHRHE